MKDCFRRLLKKEKTMKIPEEITHNIAQSENIVLLTHVNPDGDALGSLLGFADILEGAGKKVFCYLEETIPYLYGFLPGNERISTSLEALNDFVTRNDRVIAISLDCGDSKRLGKNREQLLLTQPFLVIDHHRSHRDFGTDRWVDATRSSTGEMVYELAMQMGYALSLDSAVNLYVAISTDTGSFRYDATSPKTLRIAADLVEMGVKPDEVASLVYNNYTPARLRLLELVLGTLKLYKSGEVALIHVTESMFLETGAVPVDVEGFIDFPRAINTVKVAAFVKEGKNGTVSISLRAKGECDVARIANAYNGGGHRNAAGFRFSGMSTDQAESAVIDILKKALDVSAQ